MQKLLAFQHKPTQLIAGLHLPAIAEQFPMASCCDLHSPGAALSPAEQPSTWCKKTAWPRCPRKTEAVEVPSSWDKLCCERCRAAAGQLYPSPAHSYSWWLGFHRCPTCCCVGRGMLACATPPCSPLPAWGPCLDYTGPCMSCSGKEKIAQRPCRVPWGPQ